MSLKIGPNIVVTPSRKVIAKDFYLNSYTTSQLNSISGNAVGDLVYCSDANGGKGNIVLWNGYSWFGPVAFGGTKYASGGYWYHIFSDVGAVDAFTIEKDMTVEVIIIGGGGGGGNFNTRGGGGSGAYIYKPLSLSAGSYQTLVGGGGVGHPAAAPRGGLSGGKSGFHNILALGGGDGNRGDGASGGGTSGPGHQTGRAVAGPDGTIGNPGGGRTSGSGGSGRGNNAGTGGGGMGSAGGTNVGGADFGGGNGGDGVTLPPGWNIPTSYIPSEQAVCAGGGGTGGGEGGPGGAGGYGGGGTGANRQGQGQVPATSLGSGGGAGAGSLPGTPGTPGIVIVRYPQD